jgi:glycosyltransferase involved in cell wall biosynthesis
MRILLLTAYFPPDTGSAAHLFYELGTVLVERGHQVTVVTGMPGYHAQGPLERYQGQRRVEEVVNGMDVVRVATPERSSDSLVGRALWQFGGAFAFFQAGRRLPPHDVAMLYSPPLPLGLAAWGWYKLRDIPYILNVQDLFPHGIIALGILKNPLVIRFFRAMERFMYRRSPHITVHSAGNRDHVIANGGDPERVTVVPNWVDTDFIRPGDRMNEFREEYELDDRFVASFAGVLGRAQDLDVVLEAADLVDGHADIAWLIVGDGSQKKRLETKARDMALENVLFVPMQPRERYPSVLHASDVGLATLRADLKTPVVPSKILSIMAAGLPVVAALPSDGDAPELIEKADCGLCLPPENPKALADAVLLLYHNPSLRQRLGNNGCGYAVSELSVRACVDKYEQLMQNMVEDK